MCLRGNEFQYFFYADIAFADYTRYKQSIDAITPLVIDLQILGEYEYGIKFTIRKPVLKLR